MGGIGVSINIDRVDMYSDMVDVTVGLRLIFCTCFYIFPNTNMVRSFIFLIQKYIIYDYEYNLSLYRNVKENYNIILKY